MTVDYELTSLARATQRTQLQILSQPERVSLQDIPFCARTGPFFDWSTRSCSDSWLLEVAYPPNPRQRQTKSRRRAAMLENLRQAWA